MATKFVAEGSATRPSEAASRAYSSRPAATSVTTRATNSGSRSEASAPACAIRLTPKWLRILLSPVTRSRWPTQ